jgi:hypothetical protein
MHTRCGHIEQRAAKSGWKRAKTRDQLDDANQDPTRRSIVASDEAGCMSRKLAGTSDPAPLIEARHPSGHNGHYQT